MNQVTRKDGYYISYNASPSIGNEGEETALCANGEFYILLGDFRKEYEKCKDLEECMEFFAKNQESIGSWSNNLPEKYRSNLSLRE